MTTATTTRETQITIAYEVLMMDETGKSKKDIAQEFDVSPRSVTRYFEKYEEEAMDLVTDEEPEENTQLAAAFAPKEEVEEETVETKEEENDTEIKAADQESEEETVQADDFGEEEQETSASEETKVEAEEVELKEPEIIGGLSLSEIKEQDFYEDLNDNQKKLLEDFYNQKGEMVELESRKGKRGRPSKGVKSIRFITMEIIESHKAEGTLTKENRDTVIKQIMEATGHDEKQAKKYFSGYKKVFGGWNE